MGWVAPAIGAATSIGSSIKGKQGAQEAQQQQNQYDEQLSGMLSGLSDQRNQMVSQAQNFLGGAIDPNQLASTAKAQGQGYQQNLGNLQDTLAGNVPQMNFGPIAGQGIAGSAAEALQGMGGPTYDFEAGRGIQDQAMQQFEQFAGRQRDQALEQAGRAFTGGGNALNEALAGRGISANSGVAGEALSGLARQGAQSQVDLERSLADMAGQQGLAATQFDIQSGLQREGMESNFALGAAQQLGQNLGQAGQLGLGMGQNFLTGQGQQADFSLGQASQVAQNAGLAGDLATQAYMNPLQMQQTMFQQNQMQPYLQMMGMTNPQDMMAQILALQGGNLDRRAEQNVGGNLGGLPGYMGDLQSSIKGKGAGGAGGMNPSQMSGWTDALFGGNTGGVNNPY